ncbi:MAG: hypothetical protein ACRD28_13360 [Acidobacteriaceae bacterium]
MHIAHASLPATANPPTRASASPQLVKAANAFEADFLKELLKPMREDPLFGNGSGLGGDGLGSDGSDGGSMGTVASLASDALAQAIAKEGGLGIAKMVLAQLAPVEQAESQAAALAGSTGPKCGDCARQLTIGAEAGGGLDSGSIEMLGQGNLVPATNVNLKNTTEKLARAGQRQRLPQARAVRAAGFLKK